MANDTWELSWNRAIRSDVSRGAPHVNILSTRFFARFCNLTSEKQRRGAFSRKLKWQRRTKHRGILSRAFWREFYWSDNDEAEVPEGSVEGSVHSSLVKGLLKCLSGIGYLKRRRRKQQLQSMSQYRLQYRLTTVCKNGRKEVIHE